VRHPTRASKPPTQKSKEYKPGGGGWGKQGRPNADFGPAPSPKQRNRGTRREKLEEEQEGQARGDKGTTKERGHGKRNKRTIKG